MREPIHVAARFGQWKTFFENIVVFNVTSLPVFLTIRFNIITTNDCSILNVISCPVYSDVSYLTFCSFPFLFDIYYQLILLIDAAAKGRCLQPTLPLALLLPTTHWRDIRADYLRCAMRTNTSCLI